MTKNRLLVIEDDVDVAEMLNLYFEGQGYEILSAFTGEEGIALARSKLPNLILLDIMLPDMDGFEVCRRLRNTQLTKHIPITFLTQRDARADKVAGLELGADDYLTKPFDVEELKLRVQGALRRSTRESLYETRTGLPNNTWFEEFRIQLMEYPGWRQLDLHLVGLEGFRDKYGFVAVDEVLTYTGQMLIETVSTHGTSMDFVGWRSENRYTILTFVQELPPLIEALTASFAQQAPKFYGIDDREQGYMVLNEATDYERFIPLMHLVVEQNTEAVPLNNA